MFGFKKEQKLNKKSENLKPASTVKTLSSGSNKMSTSSKTSDYKKRKNVTKKAIVKVPDTAFSGKEGINLIPPVPLAVKQKKEEYITLGVNFAFSLLLFIVLTIAIAGFNLWVELNNKVAKKQLESLETQILDKSPILTRNNQLVDRIFIYKSIEDSLYDPQMVLSYWNDIMQNFGEITEIKISNDLQFEITGKAKSLRDVATIWHLLSVDKRVNKVVLESFSKQNSKDGKETVAFVFVGNLNFETFKLNKQTSSK